MNNGIIIEMSPFQVAKGVSDKILMEASEVLQNEFLSRQKGFLKRELLKGRDGFWVDIVYWASESDAKAATKNAAESNECFTFFELLDLNDTYDFDEEALFCKTE